MKPLTLQQVRQAVAGKSQHPLRPDMPAVQAVCTDTRAMQPNSLFVALRGENFDAHAFLQVAAERGAIAAVVEREPNPEIPGLVIIKVEDTRRALGKLAKFARQQLTNTKVIAVAGSNGKTSTKHLIHAVLSTRLRGTLSPKSFNNDIGVPLTIFPADPSHDYIVLEMGTNHHGEIRVLSEMALPDIAVLTNCSAEHLEGLDDLPGVRRENACITMGMNAKGLLIVNGDDPDLLAAVAPFPGRKLTFGTTRSCDLFATDIACGAEGVRFKLNGSRVELFVPLLGRHNAINALAAVAVGRRLGLNDQQIAEGLAGAKPAEMRLQMQALGEVRMINDAYNANPASMHAALQTLRDLPVQGRRIAVLGEMRELGATHDRYHREIGVAAAGANLDQLACVAGGGQLIADAAEAAGMPAERIARFPDSAAAAAVVPGWLSAGDLVLLKASRGIRLETVANAIVDRFAPASRRAAS
jgi:UDP-N-acetylmuramoyl-tripeptide--D-alanyl-D-alanine ligase